MEQCINCREVKIKFPTYGDIWREKTADEKPTINSICPSCLKKPEIQKLLNEARKKIKGE